MLRLPEFAQFFRWYSDEEDVPSPMLRLKPPKIGVRVVPVFTEEELKSLSKSCNGKTFADRRDKAIIDLFEATGIRLAEMAGIVYDPDRPDRSDLEAPPSRCDLRNYVLLRN